MSTPDAPSGGMANADAGHDDAELGRLHALVIVAGERAQRAAEELVQAQGEVEYPDDEVATDMRDWVDGHVRNLVGLTNEFAQSLDVLLGRSQSAHSLQVGIDGESADMIGEAGRRA